MDPQSQAPAPVQKDTQEEQASSVNDVQQQVADRLLSSKSVLVTVGSSPSVDELASALGLTMLLNKLSKHVTTVFSGKIPPAMQFLDPEATFEDNVDSLRDFIIALDKEKADKLRYKVEEDVVKIFITPYQTVITEKDLEFSQGDFNVDVVVALGVKKSEALDSAILAHGRILHDAEVITITAGARSNLGSIDWNEPDVSSIAEMLYRLSSNLGENLIDEQVGTALLTGIVAETNRFSNEKTSPSVMTIAAQLMAAGANQQLVATNLRQEGMISESIRTKDTSKSQSGDDGEMVLDHKNKNDQGQKQSDFAQKSNQNQAKNNQKATSKPSQNNNQQKPTPKDDQNLNKSVDITADNQQDADKTSPEKTETDKKPDMPTIQPAKAIQIPEPPQDDATSKTTEPQSSSHKPKVIEPLLEPVETENDKPAEPTDSTLPTIQPEKPASITEPPRFGGTLNATVDGNDDAGDQALDPLSATKAPLFEHGENTEDSSNNDAIEEARRAIEDVDIEPSAPATVEPVVQPGATSSSGSVALDPTYTGSVDTTVSGSQVSSLPPLPGVNNTESTPVDDFMQPHVDNNFAPTAMNMPTNGMSNTGAMPTQANQAPGLPPLPPMPGGGIDGLPPLPPMPGAPVDPAATFQPQINPGFMDTVNQSQNAITDQGQQLTDKYAAREADRQQKIDELGSQYDSAVEKNRELQGLPPTNDHTTFPLPPPPQN